MVPPSLEVAATVMQLFTRGLQGRKHPRHWLHKCPLCGLSIKLRDWFHSALCLLGGPNPAVVEMLQLVRARLQPGGFAGSGAHDLELHVCLEGELACHHGRAQQC